MSGCRPIPVPVAGIFFDFGHGALENPSPSELCAILGRPHGQARGLLGNPIWEGKSQHAIDWHSAFLDCWPVQGPDEPR